MKADIPEMVMDVTGVVLTPGKPKVCLGNGELGFECCCDECDYYLLCFPQWHIRFMKLKRQKHKKMRCKDWRRKNN